MWLVVDSAVAQSIRDTPICDGQHFDPSPLIDGTFYTRDDPAITDESRSKAVQVSDDDFDTRITPLIPVSLPAHIRG